MALDSQEIATATYSLSLELVIRPVREDDLPRLTWTEDMWLYRNLLQKAYEAHVEGKRLFLVAAIKDYPVARLAIQISSGNIHYADGRDRAYIYAIHVMTPLQGLGIGTCLIEAAESILAQRGFRWATIAVAKTNLQARRLYERLGYRVFRQDPGQWSFTDPDGKLHQVNEPSWGMVKEL
jgi:ribosomal protein S18 acetylase RimI-like enzyme